MKIAGGLKKSPMFIEAELPVHEMEDSSKVSDRECHDKEEIISDLKELSEQEGAISCNYNEETDTIEVRFENLQEVIKFFKSLA